MTEQPLTWPVDTTTDLPPGHPDAAPPAPIPGIRYGIDPTSGARVPVYEQPAAPVQATPAPAVDTRISGRAKGVALITAAAGASLTGVTLAVGQVAPQLGTAGHAIEAAGIGVAAASAGVVLLKATLGFGSKGKTVIHHTETHNHHTTATGWFARANSNAPRNG